MPTITLSLASVSLVDGEFRLLEKLPECPNCGETRESQLENHGESLEYVYCHSCHKSHSAE